MPDLTDAQVRILSHLAGLAPGQWTVPRLGVWNDLSAWHEVCDLGLATTRFHVGPGSDLRITPAGRCALAEHETVSVSSLLNEALDVFRSIETTTSDPSVRQLARATISRITSRLEQHA